MIIPVVINVHTATNDLTLNLGNPQTPWPDVHPFPIFVPKPIKSPPKINPPTSILLTKT